VGDIVTARVVRCAERDLAVASDRELFAAACYAGAHGVDRALTAQRLVRTAEEKAFLSEEADAVEMESFSILAEAARRGVRALAVRAVSDTAATSFPYDFERMRDARGAIRFVSLLSQVARQPQRLPALVRLVRDCHLAAGQLAIFFERYLELLDVRMGTAKSAMVAAT
jgi:hypothetical protein